MTFLSTSTRPINFGRCLAILSMCVLLSGRILHSHQNCGDCCQDNSAGHNVAGHGAVHHPCRHGLNQAFSQSCPGVHEQTCPFGNDPLDDTGKTADAGCPCPTVPKSQHDPHQCAVCSVLSQAPELAVPVGLISIAQRVEEVQIFRPAIAIAGALLLPQPRGPPSLG